MDGAVSLQEARHPRAGIAVGAAILAMWAGAVAIELAAGDPADERTPVPQTSFTDARGTWPAWPGSSYAPVFR